MNFFSELLGTLKPQTPKKADENVLRQRQLTPKVTATRIPFKKFETTEEYFPDQSILEALNEIDFTEDQFRNSTELKLLLSEIVSSISLFHCWGKQSVKVRLNAFVKLLVAQLCIPQLMSLYGVGSSILSSGSDASSVAFLSRAKSVLIEAFTVFKLSEEMILDKGDDSSLDHRRFHLFIILVEFKCSPFLAHGMTVREFGGLALESLSCHILSVSAVTASVLESIKIVISRMTNVLSCETANYTIQECLPALEELVVDYFRWLRQNFDFLVRLCRKEEIITSVEASTRAWLRAETYGSPVEILSVYNQKYREKLTHMSIPLQPYQRRDIEQAKKDLVRERIVMNHVEYHGGYSVLLNDAHDQSLVAHVQKELCGMVKSELRKVMSYLFEIETFQVDVDELLNGNSEGSGDTDKESAASSLETVLSSDTKHSIALSMSTSRNLSRDKMSYSSPAQSRSSSRDMVGRSPHQLSRLLNQALSTPTHSPQARVRKGASSGSLSGDSASDSEKTRPRLRSRDLQDSLFWEFDLLDALYAYTILAASRTFAGGDAFLILNDLYGGEGLTLCPCKTPRMVIRTSPTGTPGTPKRELQQVVKKLSDTTIAITASGVKVTMRERYSLYTSAEMNSCSNPESLQPLMRFECSTVTLLILRNPSQTSVSDDTRSEKREACARLFQTLISNPEQVCHRAVTIEPYL